MALIYNWCYNDCSPIPKNTPFLEISAWKTPPFSCFSRKFPHEKHPLFSIFKENCGIPGTQLWYFSKQIIYLTYLRYTSISGLYKTYFNQSCSASESLIHHQALFHHNLFFGYWTIIHQGHIYTPFARKRGVLVPFYPPFSSNSRIRDPLWKNTPIFAFLEQSLQHQKYTSATAGTQPHHRARYHKTGAIKMKFLPIYNYKRQNEIL